MDVFLPSPGWSTTIQRMVIHHTKNGQPPSEIRSLAFSKIVTHFLKDGHQPSPGWPNTILRMVTHHSATVIWATTIPRMVIIFPRTVTHHFQDGQLELEFDSSAAQLVISVSMYGHQTFLLLSAFHIRSISSCISTFPDGGWWVGLVITRFKATSVRLLD